jgi:hypothetical protein
MEEADRCRQTARSAVGDVEPDALRETIENVLETGSVTPGTLTLLGARSTLSNRTGDGDPDVPEHVDERAAGVQLIYDGLSSIRDLAREPPWDGVVTTGGSVPDTDLTEENLSLLAADVMVARGFYLLARTEAATKAVETVRNFGRDQTHSHSGEDRDGNLEVDVLQLAVVAGVTAVGADPSEESLDTAADAARTLGHPFPPAETVVTELDLSDAPPSTAVDGVPPTSATDP